jgi:hypothetical protein
MGTSTMPNIAEETAQVLDGPVEQRDEVYGVAGSLPVVKSALTVVGGFSRELASSRDEALQGCVCWRSPRDFSTRAAVDSGIANE